MPYLRSIGLFNDNNENQKSTNGQQELPYRVLKSRLTTFLSLLSKVTSPKQLYKHQLLYSLFLELTSKPDIKISKLALDCLLTYKSSSLMPYKSNMTNLMEEKTFRDELINFGFDQVLPAHRPELITVITNLAFGRLFKGTKSSREQTESR